MAMAGWPSPSHTLPSSSINDPPGGNRTRESAKKSAANKAMDSESAFCSTAKAAAEGQARSSRNSRRLPAGSIA